MNQSLERLIELDSYLRNFELYDEFEKQKGKNNNILLQAREKIKDLDPYNDYEFKLIENFGNAIDKLNESNDYLEENFEKYDFSKQRLNDAKNDFKISIYEFLKESIKNQIKDKTFNTKDAFLKYIEITTKALWQFYVENFKLIDEAPKIFKKVVNEFSAKPLYNKG